MVEYSVYWRFNDVALESEFHNVRHFLGVIRIRLVSRLSYLVFVISWNMMCTKIHDIIITKRNCNLLACSLNSIVYILGAKFVRIKMSPFYIHGFSSQWFIHSLMGFCMVAVWMVSGMFLVSLIVCFENEIFWLMKGFSFISLQNCILCSKQYAYYTRKQ